jgi:tetratricopeptide (TPR) repeat protein
MLLINVKKALKNTAVYIFCFLFGLTAYSQQKLVLDKTLVPATKSSALNTKSAPTGAQTAPKVSQKSKNEEISLSEQENSNIVIVSKTAPVGVDITTLPLYGDFDKTEAQKVVENLFIEDCLKEFRTRQEAAAFFLKMAWQYVEEGDKALSRFNYVWLLEPKNFESYWGLGVIEYQQNQYSSAVNLFSKGITLADSNYIMMVDLATVYLKMAALNKNSLIETNEAKSWINKALVLQPNYVNAHLQLVTAFIIENRLDMAWESFHKAYELNPAEINPELLDELLSKQADPKGIFKKN